MPYCLVYTTTGDQAEAQKIGRTLVEEKLAACVNIHPIQSIYRWQGKIEEAREVAILVKTRAELADKVIERVKELHSYEIPDIISWPIERGYPDFLRWLEESTRSY